MTPVIPAISHRRGIRHFGDGANTEWKYSVREENPKLDLKEFL